MTGSAQIYQQPQAKTYSIQLLLPTLTVFISTCLLLLLLRLCKKNKGMNKNNKYQSRGRNQYGRYDNRNDDDNGNDNGQYQYVVKWKICIQAQKLNNTDLEVDQESNIEQNKNRVVYGYGLENLSRNNIQSIIQLQIQILQDYNNTGMEINSAEGGRSHKSVKIFQQLYCCNLKNLSRLILPKNKIQSIQPLSLLDLPNLQVLNLNNNLITELKSLRKLGTENLIWLQLNNNRVCTNLDWMTEMNLGGLEYLWVEFFENDWHFCQDVKWVVKSSVRGLGRLHLKSCKRIWNQEVKRRILERFIGLDVRVRNL